MPSPTLPAKLDELRAACEDIGKPCDRNGPSVSLRCNECGACLLRIAAERKFLNHGPALVECIQDIEHRVTMYENETYELIGDLLDGVRVTLAKLDAVLDGDGGGA